MAEVDFKRWSQLVAKAWADDSFKERLLQNPGAVLRENGVPVPAGLDIRIVENTENVTYLTLPAKPPAQIEELSERELDTVAAGFSLFSVYSRTQDFEFAPLFLQGTNPKAL